MSFTKVEAIYKKTLHDMIIQLTLIAALSISLVGCTSTKEEAPISEPQVQEVTVSEATSEGVLVGETRMIPNNTIIDNATRSDVLTTIVDVIQAADLVKVLKGPGPFTVFAPTNEAFNKLPVNTLNALLQTENQETLTSILKYHIVAGSFTVNDLEDGQILTTLNGQDLAVTYEEGVWMINNAAITTPNAISNNGVIHILDTVLLPK